MRLPEGLTSLALMCIGAGQLFDEAKHYFDEAGYNQVTVSIKKVYQSFNSTYYKGALV